jgi:hypothetical protein
LTQHRGLTSQRWRAFTRDQQILMIANEMQRASQLNGREDHARLHRTYERVLRLVDLTVEVAEERGLRRELLRWRDLVAELYLRQGLDPEAHHAVFLALLLLNPASARQRAYVLQEAPAPAN